MSESLVARIERTHVRTVSRVNANVRAQVEIEAEPFTATFERALKEMGKIIKQIREQIVNFIITQRIKVSCEFLTPNDIQI